MSYCSTSRHLCKPGVGATTQTFPHEDNLQSSQSPRAHINWLWAEQVGALLQLGHTALLLPETKSCPSHELNWTTKLCTTFNDSCRQAFRDFENVSPVREVLLFSWLIFAQILEVVRALVGVELDLTQLDIEHVKPASRLNSCIPWILCCTVPCKVSQHLH